MGASDSKLVFKKGIFRLSEEKDIPADDPYWTSVWPVYVGCCKVTADDQADMSDIVLGAS
jgi:hypothetical protein